MDISIIIVNYKSKGHTLNCIKSIKEADFVLQGKQLQYEIIVVDNNSEEAIGEILNWQFPKVNFIQNDKNSGMGSGNNLGIKKAQGKYVVIMNPDTIAFKNSFIELFKYMELRNEVGIVGPQLLSPNKSIQESCYRWPDLLTPVYRRTFLGNTKFGKKDLRLFLMKDYDHKKEIEVDWIQGSFLFARKKALLEVGVFDERFFMYLEDTDLCRRMWKHKWKIIYYPLVRVIHNHTRQSAQTAWYKFFLNKMARYHIISWIKYLRKWGI